MHTRLKDVALFSTVFTTRNENVGCGKSPVKPLLKEKEGCVNAAHSTHDGKDGKAAWAHQDEFVFFSFSTLYQSSSKRSFCRRVSIMTS